MKITSTLLLLSLFVTIGIAKSQTNTGGQQGNYITTAVPFLNIAPESRGGALGNTGAATSADANSMHWNPSKYMFADQSFGVSISYTPWLKALVDDINLYYTAAFFRIDKQQTISTSLRYFSLGDITFTDEFNTYQSTASPNEFAFDVAYSRLLGKNLSGSVAMRYIRSDLYNGVSTAGEAVSAANSFAADLSFFYNAKIKVGGLKSLVSGGVNFSNMGNKISYDGVTKEFLPANMRLGGAYSIEIDDYNSLALSLDFNKLMVPTPDTAIHNNAEYNKKYSDMGVPESIFTSFTDAPGGMKEELQEIIISTGLEYAYSKTFFGRAGFFYENKNKGNRQFFTAGAGLKFNMFQIDASYIIPVDQTNPLANTIRFTLAFDLSQYNNAKRN